MGRLFTSKFSDRPEDVDFMTVNAQEIDDTGNTDYADGAETDINDETDERTR
jgi:hypothetical protein